MMMRFTSALLNNCMISVLHLTVILLQEAKADAF